MQLEPEIIVMTSPDFRLKTPPAYGTVVTFSRRRGLSHGHGFAVHSNIDPSIIVIVDLQIDIVPSSGRHSQFSIMVLHPSSKMAVRGSKRPVFDHYRVKKKLMLILGDFH